MFKALVQHQLQEFLRQTRANADFVVSPLKGEYLKILLVLIVVYWYIIKDATHEQPNGKGMGGWGGCRASMLSLGTPPRPSILMCSPTLLKGKVGNQFTHIQRNQTPCRLPLASSRWDLAMITGVEHLCQDKGVRELGTRKAAGDQPGAYDQLCSRGGKRARSRTTLDLSCVFNLIMAIELLRITNQARGETIAGLEAVERRFREQWIQQG